MHIIIVPSSSRKSRQLRLGPLHLAAFLSLAAVFYALSLHGTILFLAQTSEGMRLLGGAPDIGGGGVSEPGSDEVALQTMARRVGVMQAELARLQALGSRVVEAAGLGADEFDFSSPAGQGGPDLGHGEPQRDRLALEIDRLASALARQRDQLTLLEGVMLQERARTPSAVPVRGHWISSGFGYRYDPFHGGRAFHGGVDFTAPVGTPVHAAGSGVVARAGVMSGYGKVIDIDHGDGLITRYAHLSRFHVEEGAVVLRHQKIGEVGSTGRSTGPHLHFEVRVDDEVRDPVEYLARIDGDVSAEGRSPVSTTGP